MELDPGQPWPYWAVTRSHLEFGRIEEGEAWLEKLLARSPGDPRIYSLMAISLQSQGRFAEAAALMKEHRGQSGFGVVEEEILAGCLASNGEHDEARAIVEKLFDVEDMDFAGWLAAICTQLGDKDNAFRLLERATRLGNDMLSLFEDPRHFGAIHDDPRWAPFIAGVRERVAAYQREFTWPPA
jgi:tetratricopeptide (TPR) repeat protein